MEDRLSRGMLVATFSPAVVSVWISSDTRDGDAATGQQQLQPVSGADLIFKLSFSSAVCRVAVAMVGEC